MPVNKINNGVLRTLKGVCATCNESTRNGRLYTEDLWRKAFDDDIVKEQIANGGLLMQLGHPTGENQEIDPEKVAACMKQLPTMTDNGDYVATVDLLDTPCGRIAATLVDYGYKLGISSRGSGDITTDYEGNEIVDPDSYQLTTWDLVVVPAVKKARMESVDQPQRMNASLEKPQRMALNEALTKVLNETSDKDRKFIKEALKGMDINYEDSEDITTTDTVEEDVTSDTGTEDIMSTLKEAMLKNQDLEQKLVALQEELALKDNKVNSLEEDVNRYKSATIGLSNRSRTIGEVKKQNASLVEELAASNKRVSSRDAKVARLLEAKRDDIKEHETLKKSLEKSQARVQNLKESLLASDKQVKALTEELQQTKNNAAETEHLQEQIDSLNESVAYYKKLCNDAGNKYINTVAKHYGVDSKSVKKNLKESYTLSDVDKVCATLSERNYNMSKLPFNADRKGTIKMNIVNENKQPRQAVKAGDEVDEFLEQMFGKMFQ